MRGDDAYISPDLLYPQLLQAFEGHEHRRHTGRSTAELFLDLSPQRASFSESLVPTGQIL
ncbi:MAG: hypothetical protein ACP5JG_17765 [Anaerolineae bacterium]